MTTLGERLKVVRGEVGQDEFAQRLGVHRNTYARYEREESLPDAGFLSKVCTIFGVEPAWLLIGEAPPVQGLQGKEAHLPYGSLLLRGRPGETPAEFKLIPKVRARLSAGGGSLETESEIEDYYAFRLDWISKKGNPGRMVMIDVAGDSMAPTLLDGDTVVIDQSRVDLLSGKVYAIGIGDEIVIKRVERVPSGILVISDNRDSYPPYTIDPSESPDIRIIGQLVWSAREY